MAQPRVVAVDHRGITVDGQKVRDLMLEDAFDVPTSRPTSPPMHRITPERTRPAARPVTIIETKPTSLPIPALVVETAAPATVPEPDPKPAVGLPLEVRLAAREVVSVAKELAEARTLVGVLEMRLVTAVLQYDQAAGLSQTIPTQANSDDQPGLVLRVAARIIRDWCDNRPARARGFARGRPPVPIVDRVVAATLAAGTRTSSRDAVPALAELGIRVHHNTVLRACRDAEVDEVLMGILHHEQVKCDVEVQLDIKARVAQRATELWNHAAQRLNVIS